MSAFADKIQHQANKAVATSLAGQQDSSDLTATVNDRRPQLLTQRKQAAILNGSSQNRELHYYQTLAGRNAKGGDPVAQLVQGNALPGAGAQVIQRWPVKVGQSTHFYPENDMENPRIIKSGVPFELEEADLDSINDYGYILIKIGDEKGWISYAHIMSVDFETKVNNDIEAWNAAKQTELFNQPVLSVRAIDCFDRIKDQIQQTLAEMEQVWRGTYLYNFERQLHPPKSGT